MDASGGRAGEPRAVQRQVVRADPRAHPHQLRARTSAGQALSFGASREQGRGGHMEHEEGW